MLEPWCLGLGAWALVLGWVGLTLVGMTIFSRILAGEIPCHRVYEDEHVLAFLDIGPVSDGHLLVIPKEAKAKLHELSDESAAAIGRVLPRLARAVMSATGATGALEVTAAGGVSIYGSHAYAQASKSVSGPH